MLCSCSAISFFARSVTTIRQSFRRRRFQRRNWQRRFRRAAASLKRGAQSGAYVGRTCPKANSLEAHLSDAFAVVGRSEGEQAEVVLQDEFPEVLRRIAQLDGIVLN